MFYESDLEKMVIETISNNGWKYITADELPRSHGDVMVESMVREALIRLNPEIAAKPDYADDVIYKLRTLIISTNQHNLVTQNEIFKRMIFEDNSYPFGEDGKSVSIRFFGTNADIGHNEYVVTNQWVYPNEGADGKRLDVVMLINGFPIAIGVAFFIIILSAPFLASAFATLIDESFYRVSVWYDLYWGER